MTISFKSAVSLVLGTVITVAALATAAQAGGMFHPPIKITIPPKQIQITPDTPLIDVNTKPKIPFYPLPIDWSDYSKDGNPPDWMLSCKVADNGDGMWLINDGSDDIPSGLKIKFSVPSTGDRGAFLLSRPIDGGKKIMIGDLLHGAEEGAPCKVQFID